MMRRVFAKYQLPFLLNKNTIFIEGVNLLPLHKSVFAKMLLLIREGERNVSSVLLHFCLFVVNKRIQI